MYFSFVRPIIEYCSNIWSNSTAQQLEEVEKLQKRAARIVTGGIIRTPTEILHNELGWESLQSRRGKQQLCIIT